MKIKTVGELLAALKDTDPLMPVGCYVQWSDDAAWSDEGEGVDLEVCPQGEYVARLDGWMSGYKSELEACESDDED